MKKLNKKGFTLIELLAVIVILAIIVVVTVPTVLNSIDDARKSSLHSLAKEVANWYDTSLAQDMIAINQNDTILGGARVEDTSEGLDDWTCLTAITGTKGNLAILYGLSDADLVLTTGYALDSDITTADNRNCSAIRLNNGRAEVVLVGKENGKFGARYAFSTADSSKDYTVVE